MKGNKMNLSFGLETIYEDAEFQINDKDKVGIIGVNGAGKTTLFRIILGEIKLDSGTLSTGNARIGYLPQEIILENSEQTVLEYIEEGRPIKKLENKLNDIYIKLETATEAEQKQLFREMTKAQEKLEYFDYYQAEDILLNLIESMKIEADLLNMKLKDLSGGQKSKMAFARLLYSKPEILLLDEPTNHLDVSTKAFVTNYLKEYKGMVLIISHDVEFLNSIINKVLFINKATHKILVYNGNYNTYLKNYAEEQRLKEKLITQQEKEIKELTAFITKAKQASATNHALKKMGQDREIKLEKKKQELLKRDRIYKRVKMNITPKRQGALMPLEVKNISFHYENKPTLYKNLSFCISGGERFLVVGENGVGKSTLLKLLMGFLKAQTGTIRFNPKTDIAYYAQELEQIDLNKTILDNVNNYEYTPWQIRGMLANFLFYEEDVFKKAKVLSPGEKARIALLKILMQKANLLLLDEPTNHLDPETQKIIGGNFHEYTGTIIVVSHNPAFVEQIGISRMLILPSGRIENYSPELLEYYYKLNTEKI